MTNAQKTLPSIDIHRIELPTGFAVGPVNAYVLQQGNQCILVDCGPKTAATKAALLDGLASLDLTIQDVTGLVLTHGHVDHVGLTAHFQAHGIPVYALPEVGPWLDDSSPQAARHRAFLLSLYKAMGMQDEDFAVAERELFLLHQLNDRSVVDVALVPGQVLPPLPLFRVLHVPGHAQAALALYRPDTGELLAGDQLLPTISSNALIEPLPSAEPGDQGARTPSLQQYRANLRELAALSISQVYPGHGRPFTDVESLIERRLADQERRRQQIYDLVCERPGETAFSYALTYFPHKRHEPSLILSELLGHLDWLAADGMVCEALDAAEQVIRFSPSR